MLSSILAEESGTAGMCPGGFSTLSPAPDTFLPRDCVHPFLPLYQVSRQNLTAKDPSLC